MFNDFFLPNAQVKGSVKLQILSFIRDSRLRIKSCKTKCKLVIYICLEKSSILNIVPSFLHSISQSLNTGLHISSYPFSTLACTAETMPSRIPSGSLTDVEPFPLLKEDTRVTVKTVLNGVLKSTKL